MTHKLQTCGSGACFKSGFIWFGGEAGGIETNGTGTLIAHESSWINDNRNQHSARSDFQTPACRIWRRSNHLVWGSQVWTLPITTLTAWPAVGPEHVVANLPAQLDTYDPFHTAAVETIATLQDHGEIVDVIEEPAKPRVRDLGFVASYVNHYICNGAIIMAEFGDRDSNQRAAAYMRAAILIE